MSFSQQIWKTTNYTQCLVSKSSNGTYSRIKDLKVSNHTTTVWLQRCISIISIAPQEVYQYMVYTSSGTGKDLLLITLEHWRLNFWWCSNFLLVVVQTQTYQILHLYMSYKFVRLITHFCDGTLIRLIQTVYRTTKKFKITNVSNRVKAKITITSYLRL